MNFLINIFPISCTILLFYEGGFRPGGVNSSPDGRFVTKGPLGSLTVGEHTIALMSQGVPRLHRRCGWVGAFLLPPPFGVVWRMSYLEGFGLGLKDFGGGEFDIFLLMSQGVMPHPHRPSGKGQGVELGMRDGRGGGSLKFPFWCILEELCFHPTGVAQQRYFYAS